MILTTLVTHSIKFFRLLFSCNIAIVFFTAYAPMAIANAPTRTLNEPSSLKKMVQSLGTKTWIEAWQQANILEICQQKEISPLEQNRCTLVGLNQTIPAKAPTQKQAIQHLENIAQTAAATAAAIRDFQPLNPSTNFVRLKMNAHREACRVIWNSYDKAKQAPTMLLKNSIIDDREATEKPSIRRQGCDCVQETLSMAIPANASYEEQGELQSLLTSHGCLVDAKGLNTQRQSSAPTWQSNNAQAVAEASSKEGILKEFAATQDVQLERCRQKNMSAAGLMDKSKMVQCACPIVQGWKFPKRKGMGDVTFNLTIGENISVPVTVKENGNVSQCAENNAAVKPLTDVEKKKLIAPPEKPKPIVIAPSVLEKR